MSDEFGPNFITITDEDGNDIELEYVAALEHNGVTYMAFFPTADTEEEAESAQDFGLVILKSVMENGEELLATPDTDAELNEVFDLFTQPVDPVRRAAVCLSSHFVIGDVGSMCELQASRLPSAAGSWKQRSMLETTHLLIRCRL